MASINKIREFYNNLADKRIRFQDSNRYYYDCLAEIINLELNNPSAILECGCGSGYLLKSLRATKKIGIDVADKLTAEGQKRYKDIRFVTGTVEDKIVGEKADVVVMSDFLGEIDDIILTLNQVHKACSPGAKIVITQNSYLWKPVFAVLESMGLKTPNLLQNYLPADDLENLLALCNFEVIKRDKHILLPVGIPLVSGFCNKILARLPVLRLLCVVDLVVAAAIQTRLVDKNVSCSVIVACKDEKGNIADCVTRFPRIADKQELIFVDGDSEDGTVEEIEKYISAYKGKLDIKLIKQVPNKGKGDAVRKGFEAARYDVLMILDADLTVAPEDLPRFFEAIVTGKGKFINGTRLVYPMEDQAMRTLNYLANRFFGKLFSFLLNQRLTDTLCGTKVIYRKDYEKIKQSRSYFGDFDPFGDFDLLFGAAYHKLTITEMPIVYRNRVWGDIKIHRFRHGLLLLKMAVFALFKLKLRRQG